jgi:Plavaka transposase
MIINYSFIYGLQSKLPTGATVVPVLLGIDQTHCNLLGRTKMYPLYMSIGNIPKRIRRTYSRNAFPVIAYFPVLVGTPKETETVVFRKAKSLLYHKCMSWVLRSLIEAGKR